MSVLHTLLALWKANPDSIDAQKLLYAATLGDPLSLMSHNIHLSLANSTAELDLEVYAGLLANPSSRVQAAVWLRGEEPIDRVHAMLADESTDSAIRAAGLAYADSLAPEVVQSLIEANQNLVDSMFVTPYRYSAKVLLGLLENQGVMLSHFSWVWDRQDVLDGLFADPGRYSYLLRLSACLSQQTPDAYVASTLAELDDMVFDEQVWSVLTRLLLARPLSRATVDRVLDYGVYKPGRETECAPLLSVYKLAARWPVGRSLVAGTDVQHKQFAWAWATDAERTQHAAEAVLFSSTRSSVFLHVHSFVALEAKHGHDTAGVAAELIEVFNKYELPAVNALHYFWLLDVPEFFFFIVKNLLHQGDGLDIAALALDEANNEQVESLLNWLHTNIDPADAVYAPALGLFKTEQKPAQVVSFWDMPFTTTRDERPGAHVAAQLAHHAGGSVAEQAKTIKLWVLADAADPTRSVASVVAAVDALYA